MIMAYFIYGYSVNWLEAGLQVLILFTILILILSTDVVRL